MPEPLTLTRTVPAPPEVVFAAWTTPELMRGWLFASDQGEIVRVECEPVVGGRFSILEHNGGEEIDHFGRYLVVEPGRRLLSPSRSRSTSRSRPASTSTSCPSLAVACSASPRPASTPTRHVPSGSRCWTA